MHQPADEKLRTRLMEPGSTRDTKTSALTTRYVPWKHILGSVGLVVFIIVLWSGGDDQTPAGDEIASTRAEPRVVAEPAKPRASSGNRQDSQTPAPELPSSPQQVDPRPVVRDSTEAKPAPAPQMRAKPTVTQSASGAKSDSIPKVPANEAKPAPNIPADKRATQHAQAASSAGDDAGVKVTTVALTPDERSLMRLPAGHYTLQLLGSSSLAGVQDFAREHSAQNVAIFRQRLGRKPWYVAVAGDYLNKEQAVSAYANLPAELRELEPWVRALGEVQRDIRAAREDPGDR